MFCTLWFVHSVVFYYVFWFSILYFLLFVSLYAFVKLFLILLYLFIQQYEIIKGERKNEKNFYFVQSNYEPLNRNNDCIGQWSWYYRGCWHQTCPPLEIQILDVIEIPSKVLNCLNSLHSNWHTKSWYTSNSRRSDNIELLSKCSATITACHCLVE